MNFTQTRGVSRDSRHRWVDWCNVINHGCAYLTGQKKKKVEIPLLVIRYAKRS